MESNANGSCEVSFNIVYRGGYLHLNKATLNPGQLNAWKDPATGIRRLPQRNDRIECDKIKMYEFREVVWAVQGSGQPRSLGGNSLAVAPAIKRDPSRSPTRSPGGQTVKRVQTV